MAVDVRQLQADLSAATEENRARDILQSLKSVPMTFETLAATKVAKTVKAAKKRFPELKTLTKELIGAWRKLVQGRNRAPAAPATSLGAERDGVRKLLAKEVGELGEALENELFTHFDKAAYLVKARSIRFNLGKNLALKERFIAGDITPSALAQMSSQDMASEEHQRLREQVMKEQTEARRSDWQVVNNAPSEGMFKCGKCQSKHTITEQKQTRGADEPMTTFVKCLNCGSSWKF